MRCVRESIRGKCDVCVIRESARPKYGVEYVSVVLVALAVMWIYLKKLLPLALDVKQRRPSVPSKISRFHLDIITRYNSTNETREPEVTIDWPFRGIKPICNDGETTFVLSRRHVNR